MSKIAIVGLGYVGLPLAIQFVRSGVSVIGLDIDNAKVAAVNAGQSYIKHITSETIARSLRTDALWLPPISAALLRLKP